MPIQAQNIIYHRFRVYANTRPTGSTRWPQKLHPAISRIETVDITWGALRKDNTRLPVWYANGGGADSADGENTFIWQNCGIIPKFFVFLKSGSDWCC